MKFKVVHWSKESCTLHPIVMYAWCNNTLQSFSYCFILNDLEHDTAFVYYLQSVLSENIKVSFPHLNHIEYFSDGCAAQYKNFKIFSISHFIDLILGLKLVGHFLQQATGSLLAMALVV